ncbi:patatin family protein [Pseudoclavibacter sp. CFCC 13611]|uniref:patatin-like phospholipase family protein n=1 Tax=Pseudoclavibacter sp. CFCC 13611 TaxID=2615178 RepID=UPI001CE49614|nr:patatin family protein [Pseudoclavibacter sp. CFCC 13611]
MSTETDRTMASAVQATPRPTTAQTTPSQNLTSTVPEPRAATDSSPAISAPEINVTDTALIFEGGGMRAACTAPVVAGLVRENINFGWVGGVSAGSSHTVNYLSRDPLRARKSFVDFGADPNLGSIGTWLRGKGAFNSDYIYHHTSNPGEALPLDWQMYRRNPAQFAIGAFCADTGDTVYWGRDDIASFDGLLDRVQASSTMPIFMPPVHLDGRTYVDGALGPTGGIALDAARAAGFDKFVVVLSRPRDYVKPRFRAGAAARLAFRRFPAVPAALAARPEHYNRTRAELFELERAGRAYVFAPAGLTVSNQERDVAKLAQSYAEGAAQFRSEVDAIREFVGLARPAQA